MAYLGGVIDGVLGFLGQMGDALFLLFSGDFAGAADAASTAIENFGQTMDNATESAIRLYDAEKKLEELNRNLPVQLAALKVAEDNLRESLEDQNITAEKRLAIAAKLRDNLIQQRKLELEAANAAIEAAETDEDRATATASWIVAQNNYNEARNKSALDYIKILNETAPAIDAMGSSMDRLFTKYDKELEYLDKLEKAQKKYWKARSEGFEFEDEDEIDDIPFDTEAIAAAAGATEASFNEVANAAKGAGQIMSTVASENKDVQIATALINTFAAVGIALATPGNIYTNLITAGVALASGLANVAKIENTSVPSYAVGSENIQGDQLAYIHDGERILPEDINKTIGRDVKNTEIPQLIRAGIEMPQLQHGISQMIQSQQEMNRTMKRFAYVDGKGHIHYLDGNTKTYV